MSLEQIQIKNLVADLSKKADKDDIYNQQEVDTRFSLKAASTDLTALSNKVDDKSDRNTVYNKQEVEDKLALKANVVALDALSDQVSNKADQDTVYSRSELDNKLSSKASKEDVYTQAQINEKLEVKANSVDLEMLSNKDHTHSLSEIENVQGFFKRVADVLNVPTQSIGNPSFFEGNWSGIILFNSAIDFNIKIE